MAKNTYRPASISHSLILKTMKCITVLLGLTALLFTQASAFCGFYVAKADASLFNKASQVILVRQGNQTVVTMQSDYQGKLKDFAMVIPVPEILQKDQIRVAKSEIFDKLDQYSGPRLVEYHDQHPCQRYERLLEMSASRAQPSSAPMPDMVEDEEFGVKVEATYTVGEYDIVILSANESNGLEKWLTLNGYKIPAKAAPILAPYIQSEMKFFVVKVNLEAMQSAGVQQLRPLQMTFRSEKFGLPIRLGMANANGDQDMIVYAFSDQGRIEPTNYRNVEIPTNKEIPVFVKDRFGEFYTALFDKAWKKEGKNVVFTEYAWDLSSSNFVKCDPCPTTPPAYTDLREAGIFWLTSGYANRGGSDYQGNVFMTRMHVRYNSTTFPQDLGFQVTPNRKQMQGRYIMRHAVLDDNMDCEQATPYLKSVADRRQKELATLAQLTGWDVSRNQNYVQTVRAKYERKSNGWLEKLPEKNERNDGIPFLPILIGLGLVSGLLIFKTNLLRVVR